MLLLMLIHYVLAVQYIESSVDQKHTGRHVYIHCISLCEVTACVTVMHHIHTCVKSDWVLVYS